MRINNRLCLTVLLTGLLAACATPPPPADPDPIVRDPVVDPVPPTEPERPVVDTDDEPEIEPDDPIAESQGLTPPHMKGRDITRLALLLPFSSSSSRLQDEAASMLRAAEMSVFDSNDSDVLLIALDTAGTNNGARAAVRAAVEAGADVILGPILSGEVKAASREARKTNTPLLAFSTDQTAAGNGTYLLSFPPEAEVERIVDYAAGTGIRNFAFLGPLSEYGRRVRTAYQSAVRSVGGEVTASRTYAGDDISVMQTPARQITDEFKSKRRDGARLPYEAILLPEGGTPLRSLAPLLPYYDVDPKTVQFLGTSLWHRNDVSREPALSGGLFAGPDEAARAPFENDYDARFGEAPGRLASLAYDAVSIGAYVSEGDPRGLSARLEDGAGFFGADGLVRFRGDGTPERGLAVYQIQNGNFVIVDPAPTTLTGPF